MKKVLLALACLSILYSFSAKANTLDDINRDIKTFEDALQNIQAYANNNHNKITADDIINNTEELTSLKLALCNLGRWDYQPESLQNALHVMNNKLFTDIDTYHAIFPQPNDGSILKTDLKTYEIGLEDPDSTRDFVLTTDSAANSSNMYSEINYFFSSQY